MLQKTWLVTDWVSFHQPEHSGDIVETEKISNNISFLHHI